MVPGSQVAVAGNATNSAMKTICAMTNATMPR